MGLSIHFLLFFFGNQLFPESGIAFGNPGVTATFGLMVGLVSSVLFHIILKKNQPIS
jgi:hypothetical protein